MNESALNNIVELGDIVFLVQKKFGELGWYVGKVTEIREGTKNGKDRRVVYADGDVEDNSLADLKKLVQTARATNTRRKRGIQRIIDGENASARSKDGGSQAKRGRQTRRTAD